MLSTKIKLIILIDLLSSQLFSMINCAQRPFYNLAHMSNSMDDVLVALKTGANGIEFDVQFGPDGVPLYVYHGYICDCLRRCDDREDFDQFLQFIADLSTPTSNTYNENFTFAFVDLKTDAMDDDIARQRAGKILFESVFENLFSYGQTRPRVKLLMSLLTLNDDQIVKGFMNAMEDKRATHINKYIGWDISNGQPLTLIGFLFKNLLNLYHDINIWQSDGITNCISLITPHDRLRDAVSIRDSKKSYMSKVCHWTVDIRMHIRKTLRLGVDAILTNYPARAFKILMEPEFRDKYRLANHDDDPWSRFDDEADEY